MMSDISLMVEPSFFLNYFFPVSQAEENNRDCEEEEDEWVDASDGDDEMLEEGSESDHNSRDGEKKDKGKEKRSRSKDDAAAPPAPCPQQTQAGSPKEQRTPRPKVHIPSPAPVQDSPEGGKPLSPFLPLDSHRPVSDWGEEMEMLSPRSSMGGESPLKPQSVEVSPPQKKDQDLKDEDDNKGSSSTEAAQSLEEDDTGDQACAADLHVCLLSPSITRLVCTDYSWARQYTHFSPHLCSSYLSFLISPLRNHFIPKF